MKLAFSLTLLLTLVLFRHCLVILFLLRYISLSLSLVSRCTFPNKWLWERANSESHRWTGCTLELAAGAWRQEDKSLSDCWVTGESWLGGLWSKQTLLGIWGEIRRWFWLNWGVYSAAWAPAVGQWAVWGGTEQAGHGTKLLWSQPCQSKPWNLRAPGNRVRDLRT